MNPSVEFRSWIPSDLMRQLHVRDVHDSLPKRVVGVCRKDDSLSEIVKIVVSAGARRVYVIDEHERLQGQVSLSSLSRVLLFDYQPIGLHMRSLIPVLTAKCADDIMELNRLVPTKEEECPVVDDDGRLVSCLTVVDILGRAVSSNE